MNTGAAAPNSSARQQQIQIGAYRRTRNTRWRSESVATRTYSFARSKLLGTRPSPKFPSCQRCLPIRHNLDCTSLTGLDAPDKFKNFCVTLCQQPVPSEPRFLLGRTGLFSTTLRRARRILYAVAVLHSHELTVGGRVPAGRCTEHVTFSNRQPRAQSAPNTNTLRVRGGNCVAVVVV